jgi:hypothetical protein
MSIPLHRLYHFIEDISCEVYGQPVVIYHFWPNGSKNIQDLNPMPTYYHDWFESQINPAVWCHDQEPLTYEFYKQQTRFYDNTWTDLLKSHNLFQTAKNLNWLPNIFKKNILLHSEKRSLDVEKYLLDDQLQPVYYWSHALIARDWFRYAEHATFLKKIRKRFLIYNRAWTGTREYRLKFSDLLIEHELANQCQTFFNSIDVDRHYRDHSFVNEAWRPMHILENYFPPSLADSSASSDFSIEDYQSTEIEVVLETLFDDDRLHLTEKSLRPIACRQPFILAGTHGSLQYLRDYGFQTFGAVWDESYDLIEDPRNRMQAIIDVMLDISNWSDDQWLTNTRQMDQIVQHNQKHFFSGEFLELIVNELQTNIGNAFNEIKAEPGFEKWVKVTQQRLQIPEIHEFFSYNQDIFLPNKEQYDHILQFIDDYPKYLK